LTNYLPEGRWRLKSTTSTSGKILDTAQTLIVAGGYNGFSYADIAAAIGIRKVSIHHHFPTKAELVAVLVDRYKQQAEAGGSRFRFSSCPVRKPCRTIAILPEFLADMHSRCLVALPRLCDAR
jgi:AcrR family transcriptional regulator